MWNRWDGTYTTWMGLLRVFTVGRRVQKRMWGDRKNVNRHSLVQLFFSRTVTVSIKNIYTILILTLTLIPMLILIQTTSSTSIIVLLSEDLKNVPITIVLSRKCPHKYSYTRTAAPHPTTHTACSSKVNETPIVVIVVWVYVKPKAVIAVSGQIHVVEAAEKITIENVWIATKWLQKIFLLLNSSIFSSGADM